jgi:hypothetical protein
VESFGDQMLITANQKLVPFFTWKCEDLEIKIDDIEEEEADENEVK